MSFIADNDVPNPVILALLDVNFDIKRIRDINPDAVRRDHDLMLVALDAGVAVLAPGMTFPVQ